MRHPEKKRAIYPVFDRLKSKLTAGILPKLTVLILSSDCSGIASWRCKAETDSLPDAILKIEERFNKILEFTTNDRICAGNDR